MQYPALAAALFLLTSVFSASADSSAGSSEWANQPKAARQGPALDERLPAILPGAEVGERGKSMKVWTTTGPVPVEDAPEPFGEEIPPPGVGIVIDGRRGGGHGRR